MSLFQSALSGFPSSCRRKKIFPKGKGEVVIPELEENTEKQTELVQAAIYWGQYEFVGLGHNEKGTSAKVKQSNALVEVNYIIIP